MKISPVIEVEELLKIYKNSDVMIFDASSGKNAKANYEKSHIEGSFFVDLNSQLAEVKNDLSNGGRHPLPPIETFANNLTELGISADKHIIIYDDKNGSNAAARFWWMLKSIGHEKVQVLNGGLDSAIQKQVPMNSNYEIIERSSDPYQIDNWKLPTININELESVVQNPNYLVVDVRDKERFEGKNEPIDLIAGHIPGAINIPFIRNIDPMGLFIKPAELRNMYTNLFGEIKSENIIVHCGSGVTACHTLLALDYAEMEAPKLYVGSWSEWSRNNKTIEKTNS
jgi:thiosulfate/3-mercaptopyruvate sulfurtransferase